jgi:uncharacterized protein
MRHFAVLAITSLLLTGCGGRGPDHRGLDRDETLLTLSAVGEAEARPDRANFSAGVTSYGPTAQDASAANAARMTKVIAAIEARGVAKEDIQTQSVSVSQSYYGKAKRYVASNSVKILVRKVDDVGAVIGVATAAGANEVSGPQLTISDPNAVNKNAIAAAFKAARTRADAYAAAAGMKVSRVIRIQDGQTQVQPVMYATDAAEEVRTVAPPVRIGMNSATASVTVDFALTE